MSALGCYLLPWRGLGAVLRRPGALALALATALLLALPCALICAAAVDGIAAHHPDPTRLAIGWELELEAAMRGPRAASAEALGWAAAAAMAAAFLGGVFLAGGWVAVFGEEPGAGWLFAFAGGGARFFARFLRLDLIALAGLVGLQALLFEPGSFGRLLELLSGESNLERLPDQGVAAVIDAVRVGVFLLLLGAVVLVTRLAKVFIALDTRSDEQGGHDERRSAAMAWFAALCFCLRRPLRTALLALGCLAVHLVFLAAASQLLQLMETALEAQFGAGSSLGYGGAILLTCLAAHWIRGASYSAVVEYYLRG